MSLYDDDDDLMGSSSTSSVSKGNIAAGWSQGVKLLQSQKLQLKKATNPSTPKSVPGKEIFASRMKQSPVVAPVKDFKKSTKKEVAADKTPDEVKYSFTPAKVSTFQILF